MSEEAVIRTVEVVPPSRRGEETWVFLGAAAIALAMVYAIAFERQSAAGPGGAAAAALPFQVLFCDLPGTEQRMFRQMQEGFTEALRLRSSSGQWPAVGALAAEGIPPFARDPLDRHAYRWSLARDGLLLEYRGVPTEALPAPAFLITLREPDPVAAEVALPGDIDEEHQPLPGGQILHVTYWFSSAAPAQPAPVARPEVSGFRQIRLSNPFDMLLKGATPK